MEELLKMTFADTRVWIERDGAYTIVLDDIPIPPELLGRFQLAGAIIALAFVWLRKAPVNLNPFFFLLLAYGPDELISDDYALHFAPSKANVLKYLPNTLEEARDVVRGNVDIANLCAEVFQRDVRTLTCFSSLDISLTTLVGISRLSDATETEYTHLRQVVVRHLLISPCFKSIASFTHNPAFLSFKRGLDVKLRPKFSFIDVSLSPCKSPALMYFMRVTELL